MASNIEPESVDEIGPVGDDDLSRRIHNVEPDEKYYGLTEEQLVEIYRDMYLSRAVDDAEIRMKSQQKTFFQIAGAGHEAALVTAGKLLEGGYDWFYPYYRDLGLALTVGMTPLEVIAQGVGSKEDPSSGGRQMPHHWGHKDLNIVSQASCTGTQILQAVGASEVGRIVQEVEEMQDAGVEFEDDEVVYVSIGDGATSEGEFWEGVNHAANNNLPVLFMVEDNGYAISVPTEIQTAGGSISKATRGFEGLYITEFDGCDPIESYGNLKAAVDYIRAGKGPALAHAHVIRPYSHSVSDDEKSYKPESEREAEAKRDPLKVFPKFLVDEGIATESELESLRDDVDEQVSEAVEASADLEQPEATPEAITEHIYSEDVDPTSADFDTEPDWDEDRGECTMVDLLNDTLKTEMRRDSRIVVFGEDVADVTKEEYINDVKGKGGVFKVTHGLQKEFGGDRVFNSPLAEANIIGRAIGMATRGLKPIAEIQFYDYIWPAFMQLRNELSNIRWRSDNHYSAPVVVRVPIGGYLKGGGPYHSQSGTTMFTSIPGLRVVLPSTADDAAGLLRTAIQCEDPVMFLEPKHLYRQTHNKSLAPGPDYKVPFGKARTVQEGDDLTIITYGSTVQRSVQAAKRSDANVEVIDLRTLNPYDWDAIAKSVKKTNKVMVVYEDTISWGYGTELATRIGDELFEYLDGPVKRVAAMDTFVAYNPKLEEVILPQVEEIADEIEWLYNY